MYTSQELCTVDILYKLGFTTTLDLYSLAVQSLSHLPARSSPLLAVNGQRTEDGCGRGEKETAMEKEEGKDARCHSTRSAE